MQDRKYWYGKEVEGRYYGLWTLFNRHEVGPITDTVHHLYFTNEFWQLKDAAEQIEKYIIDYPVSVEVDNTTFKNLTPNIKVRAHILYRIKDKQVFDLKDTDSVFIDGEIYNVLCFTKHNALKVGYADYAFDIENND